MNAPQQQPDFGTNIEAQADPGVAPDVIIPDENTPVLHRPTVGKGKKPNQLARYKKRVWIVLEDNENIPPTGQFFGHQGIGFILQPGKPAEVPVEIIEILNNAEYLAPVVDQATRQIIDYRPRLRFPYRVVPAPQEQAA